MIPLMKVIMEFIMNRLIRMLKKNNKKHLAEMPGAFFMPEMR